MTHVYVIQAEGGPVKVGVAGDPLRRLVALQTASFARLSLHFAKVVPSGQAAQVEARAHQQLADKRRAGEWFDVPAATAADALVSAARDLGVDLQDRGPTPIPQLDGDVVTGEQLRGARAMARIEQRELAQKAGVSVDTIKRLERTVGPISANVNTMASIVRSLEEAGIEFTNGGKPGVRIARKAD